MKTKQHTLRSWVYAIKLASWPKIIVPAWLGLSIGWKYQELQWESLIFSIFLAVFLVISIVLCNDWADIKVDTIKRKQFPHTCSPKTIPDRILSIRSIKLASFLSILGFLSIGCFYHQKDPDFIYLPFLAILFIQSYSFSPLKLNYRGGGEWIETIGVGLLLPLLFLRATGLKTLPEEFLIICAGAPSAMASALASGLADEESDRIGGKKTYTTSKGHLWVRDKVLLCIDLTSFMWIFIAYTHTSMHTFFGASYLIFCRHKLHQHASKTQTHKFKEIKTFKTSLHNSIWGSYSLISISIFLSTCLKF
ncbi:MAG: prenyltransferase [Oligoflexales bacterium]